MMTMMMMFVCFCFIVMSFDCVFKGYCLGLLNQVVVVSTPRDRELKRRPRSSM